jgi:cation-transporting ATPase E
MTDYDIRGLSSSEAAQRAAKGLQNKVRETKSKKVTEIFIENIFSVFNLIILIVIIFLVFFYFRSGDDRLVLDSIGVSLVAIINTLIAIVQEIRAKRALDKVSLLLKREVKVIRDGREMQIDQEEIVVDDIVIAERGDQIAVDGKVLRANRFEIDESLMTGESVPIEKKEGDKVMSGSFCVSGNGIYAAEKVGDESYAAGITKLAKKFKVMVSPLQSKINWIVKGLFATAVVLVLLKLVFRGGDFGQVDFVREISTIIISLVPQGLVLMASVTFALGIYRISKIGAIIQKLNAIEMFSNVKVVCTDKTGTLTQNKLAVNKVTLVNNKYDEESAKELLGTYAKFSSDKNATLRTLEVFPAMEGVEVVDEIPFSSEKKYSIIRFEVRSSKLDVKFLVHGSQFTVVLGAYDVLLENVEDKSRLEKISQENGLEVYRNLSFGFVRTEKGFSDLAEGLEGVMIEPICIVSISDQVREDVMEAIELFDRNEIKIKILSGDSATAIQAVAREIGWEVKDDELISGRELDNVSDSQLDEIVNKKVVFARLRPEHKLKIIRSFKRQGVYTAMIGDGVNDLPAIKESDMGIAMEEGSGITKEVADIVLLKNKFSLLPNIFDEGNKIINTVNRVAKLFLTKNFMIIYSTLMTFLFLFDFPFTPRRVALINLFSIGLPSLMIAVKNADVSRTVNFMKDLFSFVIISALVITAAGYAGQIISTREFGAGNADLHMIMVSIMIFITTANFWAAIIGKAEKNKRAYFIYGIALIAVYILLSLTDIDFAVIKFVKTFYEIGYLKPEYWGLVGWISLAGGGMLMLLQLIRGRVINRSK